MKTLLGYHVHQTGVRAKPDRVFLGTPVYLPPPRRPTQLELDRIAAMHLLKNPRAPQRSMQTPGFWPQAVAAIVVLYAMLIAAGLSL